MRIARATAVGILIASILALGGCKKKKPPLPPPQAEAPTISQPQPETTPPPAPASAEPNRPQPEAPAPETTAPQPATAPAPKPKRKPHITAKKPPEKPPEKQPSKTVVTEGGAQPASPQISASMPHDDLIHQQFTTTQLLEATDYNLKSITRQLTAEEQAMVQTIHSYQEKSRQATKEGDGDLAYRLAFKAHQLSDALVKR